MDSDKARFFSQSEHILYGNFINGNRRNYDLIAFVNSFGKRKLLIRQILFFRQVTQTLSQHFEKPMITF